MNREIKFRAWLRGELIYSDKLYAVCVNQTDRLYHFFKYIRFDSPLMQSTGLKDKNGVEIYEGDVVRWKSAESWHSEVDEIYEVRFGETRLWSQESYAGSVGFYLAKPRQKDPKTPYGILHLRHEGIFPEVIGNIYENPELLSPTI